MPSTISMITRITFCASTILARPSTFVKAFSTHIPSRAIVSQSRQSNINININSAEYFTSSSRKMSTSATEGKEVTKRVLVPIAEDSEEIETTCITDVLVRFGADVVVASVKANGDLVCKMSRGIKVKFDFFSSMYHSVLYLFSLLLFLHVDR